jgi:hypothetical protein
MACMMRPGRKVKSPAITRAPRKTDHGLAVTGDRVASRMPHGKRHIARVKIANRWIGLHGPHKRISWMKNALMLTAAISATQPIVR